MKVSYTDGVFEELLNLSFHLADADEEIAQKFLNACNDTFLFLAENKYVGSIRKFKTAQLSEVRMWRVKGFEKYLIFYTPTENGIRILHVIHSATDYNWAFEDE
jgi:toxin ParE1/3/4